VRIANDLFEAIIRTPMSAREVKVLLAVARETYGWNCKAKTVTAYRVAQMTRIDRTHASRAMKDLLSRKILSRDGEAIGIQKDYDRWEGANRTGVQNAPGAVRTVKQGANRTGTPGANRHTYKDRKDRKTEAGGNKTPPAPPVKALLTEYERLHLEHTDEKPFITAADAALAAKLLKRYGADKTTDLLRYFYRNRPRWARDKNRYDFKAFAASVEDLIGMQRDGV